jgi:hypothetical protein
MGGRAIASETALSQGGPTVFLRESIPSPTLPVKSRSAGGYSTRRPRNSSRPDPPEAPESEQTGERGLWDPHPAHPGFEAQEDRHFKLCFGEAAE